MASFEVILCYLDERAEDARRFVDAIRACQIGTSRWGIAVDAQIELHHQLMDKAVKDTETAQPWTDVELILGHRATAEQVAPPELTEQVLASAERYATFAAGDRPPRYEPLDLGQRELAANPLRYDDVSEPDFWASVGLTMWLTRQPAVAQQPVLLRELLLTNTRSMQALDAGEELVAVSDDEACNLLRLVLGKGVPAQPTNAPQFIAFSLARQWLTDHDGRPNFKQLKHLRARVHAEHARLTSAGLGGPLTAPVEASNAISGATRRRGKRKRK
ncbi:hypothetical protein [Nocardia suismassiliense]|uniref:hypothetical protein n=1 Tax=Nocardia suismassiliense TaxID=2077092 RepID=UPI000D1F42C2|nr:hypothetical protein [Nocardia suismassiliense]